jgi:hypothetical protein
MLFCVVFAHGAVQNFMIWIHTHTYIYIWILCETKQNPRTPLEAAFAATTELCTSNRWKRWLWVEYTGCTLIWLVSWTFLIVQGDSHPIFGLSNQKV